MRVKPLTAILQTLLLLLATSGAVPAVARKKQGSAASSSKLSTASTSKPSSKSKPRASSKRRTTTARQRMPTAPTPARVSEIQSALADQGAYQGAPNGKWDPSTIDAMQRFQRSHGLNPTGKLDAPTLEKLGLGSETSGVAAPLPQVHPTTNILLTPSTNSATSAQSQN